MTFVKDCKACGKPLKPKTMPGGKRAMTCKTPTCKNFGKAIK